MVAQAVRAEIEVAGLHCVDRADYRLRHNRAEPVIVATGPIATKNRSYVEATRVFAIVDQSTLVWSTVTIGIHCTL